MIIHGNIKNSISRKINHKRYSELLCLQEQNCYLDELLAKKEKEDISKINQMNSMMQTIRNLTKENSLKRNLIDMEKEIAYLKEQLKVRDEYIEELKNA